MVGAPDRATEPFFPFLKALEELVSTLEVGSVLQYRLGKFLKVDDEIKKKATK